MHVLDSVIFSYQFGLVEPGDGLPVPCLDKSTDVVCLLVFRSIPFSSLSATVLDFN